MSDVFLSHEKRVIKKKASCYDDSTIRSKYGAPVLALVYSFFILGSSCIFLAQFGWKVGEVWYLG